jgi:5-methylcytosine-specific restriction endonuclease McrA
MKVCTKCNREQDDSCFYRESSSSGALRARCINCLKSHNRQYYIENADKIKLNSRKWYRENQERALAKARKWQSENLKVISQIKRRSRLKRKEKLILAGSYTQQEWNTLVEKYGGFCLRCFKKDVPLAADHVVPVSKGGANTIDNIQPLCGPCNSRKFVQVIDYRPDFYDRMKDQQ